MIHFKNVISTLLYFIYIGGVYSQSWSSLTSGTDRQVRCLFSDTVSNKLYIGGGFITAGGLNARGIATWNGITWDTLGSGIDDFNPSFPGNVLAITRYNNQIYVGGAFETAGGIQSHFLAVWDSNSWLPHPFTLNEAIYFLNTISNKLILGGVFTRIDTLRTVFYAAYDLQNIYSPQLNLDSTFGAGYCFANYNGKSLFGGNLISSQGEDLLSWDSTAINSMGILGGSAYITSMTIFNNELYIAGNFQKANGNIGDNLIKWDGSFFSEVGGGVNNQVNCLKVYNGELYVGGIFNMAGSLPVTYIAKWDGTNWHSLNNTLFDNGITSMEIYKNELYVGGGFTHINNIPMNNIAKYSLNNSLEELENNEISISQIENYILNIKSYKNVITRIEIRNIFNQRIYSTNILESTYQLNISNFAKGIYLLLIEMKKGMVIKKIVKE